MYSDVLDYQTFHLRFYARKLFKLIAKDRLKTSTFHLQAALQYMTSRFHFIVRPSSFPNFLCGTILPIFQKYQRFCVDEVREFSYIYDHVNSPFPPDFNCGGHKPRQYSYRFSFIRFRTIRFVPVSAGLICAQIIENLIFQIAF